MSTAFDGTIPAPARGEGEAADGQVRAVAEAGRLTELRLEPRLMRSPPDELADLLREAANAAFGDLRVEASGVAPGIGAVDARAFAARLEEVQAQGMRTLGLLTRALTDAMDQVRDRTGMAGDPGPKGLEQIVEEARGVA